MGEYTLNGYNSNFGASSSAVSEMINNKNNESSAQTSEHPSAKFKNRKWIKGQTGDIEHEAHSAKALAYLTVSNSTKDTYTVNKKHAWKSQTSENGSVYIPLEPLIVTSPIGPRILNENDYLKWRDSPGHPTPTHYGIDFSTSNTNQPIRSMFKGKVVFADRDTTVGTYGGVVTVQTEINGNTVYVVYAHLSAINVRIGNEVTKGHQIGISGGDAKDPGCGVSKERHLHVTFLVVNGKEKYSVDPIGFINNDLKITDDIYKIDAANNYILMSVTVNADKTKLSDESLRTPVAREYLEETIYGENSAEYIKEIKRANPPAVYAFDNLQPVNNGDYIWGDKRITGGIDNYAISHVYRHELEEDKDIFLEKVHVYFEATGGSAVSKTVARKGKGKVWIFYTFRKANTENRYFLINEVPEKDGYFPQVTILNAPFFVANTAKHAFVYNEKLNDAIDEKIGVGNKANSSWVLFTGNVKGVMANVGVELGITYNIMKQCKVCVYLPLPEEEDEKKPWIAKRPDALKYFVSPVDLRLDSNTEYYEWTDIKTWEATIPSEKPKDTEGGYSSVAKRIFGNDGLEIKYASMGGGYNKTINDGSGNVYDTEVNLSDKIDFLAKHGVNTVANVVPKNLISSVENEKQNERTVDIPPSAISEQAFGCIIKESPKLLGEDKGLDVFRYVDFNKHGEKAKKYLEQVDVKDPSAGDKYTKGDKLFDLYYFTSIGNLSTKKLIDYNLDDYLFADEIDGEKTAFKAYKDDIEAEAGLYNLLSFSSAKLMYEIVDISIDLNLSEDKSLGNNKKVYLLTVNGRRNIIENTKYFSVDKWKEHFKFFEHGNSVSEQISWRILNGKFIEVSEGFIKKFYNEIEKTFTFDSYFEKDEAVRIIEEICDTANMRKKMKEDMVAFVRNRITYLIKCFNSDFKKNEENSPFRLLVDTTTKKTEGYFPVKLINRIAYFVPYLGDYSIAACIKAVKSIEEGQLGFNYYNNEKIKGLLKKIEDTELRNLSAITTNIDKNTVKTYGAAWSSESSKFTTEETQKITQSVVNFLLEQYKKEWGIEAPKRPEIEYKPIETEYIYEKEVADTQKDDSKFRVYKFSCMATREFNLFSMSNLGRWVNASPCKLEDTCWFGAKYRVGVLTPPLGAGDGDGKDTATVDADIGKIEDFIASWMVKSSEKPKFQSEIPIEGYYDTISGMTPFVEIGFRTGINSCRVDPEGICYDQFNNPFAKVIQVAGASGGTTIKIQKKSGESYVDVDLASDKEFKNELNSKFFKINSIDYPYIQSVSITDNGVKKVDIRLVDPNFASYTTGVQNGKGINGVISLESLIRGALQSPFGPPNELSPASSYKQENFDGTQTIKEDHIKIESYDDINPTNLKVRIGYADYNIGIAGGSKAPEYLKDKTGENTKRWWELERTGDRNELQVEKIKKYVINGEIQNAGGEWKPVSVLNSSAASSNSAAKPKGNELTKEMQLQSYSQTSNMSQEYDFMIIGFESTLTNKGIEYSISGIETKDADLINKRFLQRFANITSYPAEILYALMAMFNENPNSHKNVSTSDVKIVLMEDPADKSEFNNKINMLLDLKSQPPDKAEKLAETGILDTYSIHCTNDGTVKLNKANLKQETVTLGGEGALRNYNAEKPFIPLYKTVAQLINEFCAICPPKKKYNYVPPTVDQNGNKTISDAGNSPARPLKWFTYKDNNNGITYIVLYYRGVKKIPRIRVYTWGPNNPNPSCVKSVSIKNKNEFAVLSAIKSFDGVRRFDRDQKNELQNIPKEDFDKFCTEGTLGKANIVGINAKNYDEAYSSCMYEGSISILGDPFYFFDGSMQPCTYPIKLDVVIPQSEFARTAGFNADYKVQMDFLREKFNSRESGDYMYKDSWTLEHSDTNQFNEPEAGYYKIRQSKGSSNQVRHETSGYYVIKSITHTIDSGGYTTNLEVMKYPNIDKDVLLSNEEYLESKKS